MEATLAIPLYQAQPFDPHKALKNLAGEADWIGLRYVEEKTHTRAVRNTRPEENSIFFDRGVMVEVLVNGHFGYAGTSDLSTSGLSRACQQAKELATVGSRFKVFNFDLSTARPKSVGHFRSPYFRGLDGESLKNITDTLRLCSEKLKASDKIVNAFANSRLV
jgi:predicted Zn-dependent protease